MFLEYFPLNCTEQTEGHCTLIKVTSLLESLLLCGNAFGFAIAMFIVNRTPFHYNLRVISLNIMGSYYAALLARIVTISYEVKWMPLEGDAEGTRLLVLASWVRVFYMAVTCGAMMSFAMERFCATLWVHDYEVRRRKWISYAFVFVTFGSSAISASAMTWEWFPLEFIIGVGFCCTVSALCMFVRLYTRNLNHLNALRRINKPITNKYTLSLRFQLNENLRIMKIFRNVIIVCGSFNMFCCFLLLAEHSEAFKRRSPIIGLYAHAALNVTVGIYGMLVLLVALVSDDNYRKFFLSFKIVRALTVSFLSSCYPQDFEKPLNELSVNDETVIYFTSLTSQWEQFRLDAQPPARPRQKSRRSKRVASSNESI